MFEWFKNTLGIGKDESEKSNTDKMKKNKDNANKKTFEQLQKEVKDASEETLAQLENDIKNTSLSEVERGQLLGELSMLKLTIAVKEGKIEQAELDELNKMLEEMKNDETFGKSINAIVDKIVNSNKTDEEKQKGIHELNRYMSSYASVQSLTLLAAQDKQAKILGFKLPISIDSALGVIDGIGDGAVASINYLLQRSLSYRLNLGVWGRTKQLFGHTFDALVGSIPLGVGTVLDAYIQPNQRFLADVNENLQGVATKLSEDFGIDEGHISNLSGALAKNVGICMKISLWMAEKIGLISDENNNLMPHKQEKTKSVPINNNANDGTYAAAA